MGKDFWGSSFWGMIHTMSRQLAERQNELDELMHLTVTILPCDECSEHLESNLKRFPPHGDLFLWSYQLHDTVNKQINEKYGYLPDNKNYKSSPPFASIVQRYSSMSSSEFGPMMWRVIHTAATAYRPEKYEAFKSFMDLLTRILPEETWRKNLQKALREIPMEPYSESQHNMFFWTYLIHHAINRYRGAVGNTPEYNSVKEEYFKNLVDGDCKSCGTY